MKALRQSAAGEWFTRLPRVIAILIATCTIVWFLELLKLKVLEPVWPVLWLDPRSLFGKLWLWQLVSYQFLHDPTNLAHILFNMFALWMFGCELYRVWGTGRFLAFYLTCGAVGGLAHAMLSRLVVPGGIPVIGASGAVMGLFAAWAAYWPTRRILMFFVVPMEVRYAVLVTAAIELLLAWDRGSGVANFAHLGGMADGYLYCTQGGRLRGLGRTPAALVERIRGWKRALRRGRMKVVKDRDWNEWLEDNDPDDRQTRH